MLEIRFLIDDVGQCGTQRAVLSAFANALMNDCGVTVVRSSELSLQQFGWDDVPPESSRRLALRALALAPSPDRLTVFLPGHVIPGPIAPGNAPDRPLAAAQFTTVADLDIFVMDNRAADAHRFREFVNSHADYETVSRYDAFDSCALPDWLIEGGLTSALNLSQRPWYSGYAPTRTQWLHWVAEAIDQGLITPAMVEDDVRKGLARPSLLHDIRRLPTDAGVSDRPDMTLDSLFVFPECRLSDTQYQMLLSEALQERTVAFAGRNAKRKAVKLKMHKWTWERLRHAPQGVKWKLIKLGHRFLHAAYTRYSASLRPMAKRLSQRNESSK
ncbi:hypothetical protein [Methyloversatilis thermotolerans]|uniref:hypothetical protein n=1 Tax=Methyloversatilis thermotolerans TaxID=1346290 RepID=UPI000361F0FC|nr:hypothetical protein [Methyloversatilis thermotolerans]